MSGGTVRQKKQKENDGGKLYIPLLCKCGIFIKIDLFFIENQVELTCICGERL